MAKMLPRLCEIKRLNETAIVPQYQTSGASGLDLHASASVVVLPGRTRVVSTGIALAIPSGYEGQIRPRSGLARNGIVAQLGTIDSDYRGEIGVILHNNSSESYSVQAGDRIAQMVIHKVERVALRTVPVLSPTSRGEGGFGSTGT